MTNSREKIVRDPIYEYIDIGPISNIVDTQAFQRLRRISHSSYSPLYPSALHNRFVHSLGVYHLGKIAIDSFKLGLENLGESFEAADGDVFVKACLLHDIGHAPFSHTGEEYYFSEKTDEKVGNEFVCKIVYDLAKEIDELEDKELIRSLMNAAPHEVMSAYIGLKNYASTWNWKNDEKRLFARCITGAKYENNDVRNCMIEILNSKTIDVDKIDYLLRDSYVTGFPNSPIDYNRLLKNITVIKHEGHIHTAFKKNALSILENVVYARDVEKKWIQTHPTILYENYLIKHAIEKINRTIYEGDATKHFFNYESLIDSDDKSGIYPFRLLSDEDILYHMKYDECFKNDPFIEEFFDRTKRRHALWKSEFELNALADSEFPPDKNKEIIEAFTIIAQTISNGAEDFAVNGNCKFFILNKKVVDTVEESGVPNSNKLKSFFDHLEAGLAGPLNGKKLDLAICTERKFGSGFGDLGSLKQNEFGKILIDFPSVKPKRLSKVMPKLIQDNSNDREEPFFAFTNMETGYKREFLCALRDAVKSTYASDSK
jgi:HD superfamily phosphohydrolase